MIIPYVNQSLPLDQLRDTPAAAAYGLRRLKSGYKGAPIKVRDDTNTETDIPFCGQDLCTSTLLSWLSRNQVANIPLGVDGNEDGVSDGWTSQTRPGITATFSIDDSSQKINITNSTTTNAGRVFKEIGVVVGSLVTVNTICKVDNSLKMSAGIQIDWFTGAGGVGYISSSTAATTTATTYTARTVTVVAPATALFARVYFYVIPTAIGDTGSAWHKDASVTISNQSGYVVTLYDQSGNGLNATQATAGNQPRIVNAGVVDVDASGKPTMYFDGTDDVLTNASVSISNIASISAVVKSIDLTASTLRAVCISDATGGSYSQFLGYKGSTTTVDFGLRYPENQPVSKVFSLANFAILSYTRDTTTSQNAWFNGAIGTVNANATTTGNGTRINIGANRSSSADVNFWKGNISEVIVLQPLSDSARQKYEKNAGKYYGLAVA